MQKFNFKRSLSFLVFSLSSALLFSTPALAIGNINDDTSSALQTDNNSVFSKAELEQMLAPIALYPDALLTHILIATTYPIEVVDAERWINKNKQLSSEALLDAAENKDWDASVKALLPFPSVLKKLSEDLHWMRNLGDAFLQDEALVLASVQTLRQQADQAGNLENMNNVKVVRDTQTIIIEPKQNNIIYVPYYDTRVVYGHWRWSHYPPIFWRQPQHFTSHHGPYYWHNPVQLSVGLFFGAVHWSNHHVVVQHQSSRYYKHHSNKKVSTSYQAKRWQHNPRHRKGVAYRTSHIQKKYRSHTPSVQQHKMLRSKQKHFVDSHQYTKKNSSSKHQNLQYKLKVNRAVKIDNHQNKKKVLTKSMPYTDNKWRETPPANIKARGKHLRSTKTAEVIPKKFSHQTEQVKYADRKSHRKISEKNTHQASSTKVAGNRHNQSHKVQHSSKTKSNKSQQQSVKQQN
ncbi:DUF3300 domain-containing protein [Colwellia sp. M166]|uniref:DUF3300 domain-containing protein n=1 Tax=Colwellia sp. M166 TaxID=2583805 RepID=UPI00211E8917|nr:DUF3300 domain-containing protein [Colwellia sp. M166]UUO21829.1 DUF3300 domain-containing protein [Colwellia sp. M166]|tara:strand:+ start:5464 stop:6843 length:1380 start_codon:yes stop_codon:yes gene_type:complete